SIATRQSSFVDLMGSWWRHSHRLAMCGPYVIPAKAGMTHEPAHGRGVPLKLQYVSGITDGRACSTNARTDGRRHWVSAYARRRSGSGSLLRTNRCSMNARSLSAIHQLPNNEPPSVGINCSHTRTSLSTALSAVVDSGGSVKR